MDKRQLIKRLEEIVGAENVLSSDVDLELYSYDASLDRARPDVVVLPGTTEEVSKIMALAHKEKIPRDLREANNRGRYSRPVQDVHEAFFGRPLILPMSLL